MSGTRPTDKPATHLADGRRDVLERRGLAGRDLVRELSDATDSGVRELFARVCPDDRGLALVALGGYGRGELAPSSDLDVLLLHDGKRRDVESVATALWYPLWDVGLRLGHAVRTRDEHLRLADDDIESATATLSARHLAGRSDLTDDLRARATASWQHHGRRRLSQLRARDLQRHERAGEVAYLLEPDVKDGVGGLRDVQSLSWARLAGLDMLQGDIAVLDDAAAELTDVRVALHRVAGRYGEVLRLESQAAVAELVGAPGDDELMADLAGAGRVIAWIYEQSWSGWQRGRVRRHRHERLGDGIELALGSVELTADADPGARPTLLFDIAIAAARREAPIGRRSLARLSERLPTFPDPWPDGWVDGLVGVLREAHRAIPVLESLDQVGLLTRVLPEWSAVRSKPQRNAYHRFTVDRHLWEAAANAATLAGEVARPDLLVLAALFHDIGKGFAGDHTDVGVELMQQIGPRLGLDAAEVATLTRAVRHHLLLPDVAMRRDLADPATAANIAAAVGTVDELELLHALTIADSMATGPTAWSDWKAGLVAELVARTRRALGDAQQGEPEPVFPDPATLDAMRSGELDVRIDVDAVTTVSTDVPGSFAQVAGALSLHRLDVVSATAHSESCGPGSKAMAAARFRFLHEPQRPIGEFADALRETIERALAGELAIEARLAERARSAGRRRRTQAAGPGAPSVNILDDASDDATVIEVRAPTRPGLLHQLAKAVADVGLDIRHATVQTIGPEAVDTFYVLNAAGMLVTDPFHLGEIRRALLHAAGNPQLA